MREISFYIDREIKILFKNAGNIFASHFFNFILSFLQGILIARILGVYTFGLISLIIGCVNVVNQIFDFRVFETAVKYSSEYIVKDDKPRLLAVIKLCYLVDFLSGLFSFLFIFFTSRIIALKIIHHPELEGLILLFAFTLLISTVNNTSLGILTAYEKFRWISFQIISTSLLRFLFIFLFLILDKGIRGVLWGYLFADMLGALLFIFLVYRIISKKVYYPGINASLRLLSLRVGELFRFLLSTHFNEFFTLFTKNIDIIILGFFKGPNEVGYFKFAKNCIESFALISSPIYNVIYPHISKLYSLKKFKELLGYIKKISIIIFILLIPLGIFVFYFSSFFIERIVGKNFLPSVELIKIMFLGISTAMILVWIRPVFLSIGKPYILTFINIFLGISLVLLSLVFVPRFGYIASAWIYNYPYILGNIISLFIFLKICKLNIKTV